MDKEEKPYFNYLVSLIKNKNSKEFQLLLERLWDKEYYSVLPNDQNREKDGIFLREEFGIDSYTFGPCRVLEMIIGVSRRAEYEVSGTELEKSSRDFFWELINNLGLLKFDNLSVVMDAQILELDTILTNWLDRKYKLDGCGGIFPIQKWKQGVDMPQNKVEVWYQMMLYLSKNYKI